MAYDDVYAQVPLEAHGGALQDSTQVHGAWVHLEVHLRVPPSHPQVGLITASRCTSNCTSESA